MTLNRIGYYDGPFSFVSDLFDIPFELEPALPPAPKTRKTRRTLALIDAMLGELRAPDVDKLAAHPPVNEAVGMLEWAMKQPGLALVSATPSPRGWALFEMYDGHLSDYLGLMALAKEPRL